MKLSVSEQALITSISIVITLVVIHTFLTFHEAQKLYILFDSGIKRKIICVTYILFYELNQAVQISLIVYFYEIGRMEFFITLLILFICSRLIIAGYVCVENERANIQSFFLYFIYDNNLYRSLLIDYVCKSNKHQTILISVQTYIVTIIQAVTCLIALILDDRNTNSILLFSFILSVIMFVLTTTRYHFRFAIYSCTYLFCQVLILTLTYLVLSYIAFYIVFPLQLIAFTIHLMMVFMDVDEEEYIHAIIVCCSFCCNLVLLILITVFTYVPGIPNHIDKYYQQILPLLIISWILCICIPMQLALTFADISIVKWCTKQTEYHSDGYLMANFEEKYFTQSSDLLEIITDFEISKELGREHRTSWKINQILLIGDDHANTACRTFKQLKHNEHQDEEEYSAQITFLAFGFVREFENLVNISIPIDVIMYIAKYAWNSEICLECMKNKLAVYNNDIQTDTFQLVHMHKLYQVSKPNVLCYFEHCVVTIYTVSLSMYDQFDEVSNENLMRQSIETFADFMHKYMMDTMNFMLLFVDLAEFEDKISNGISLSLCFKEYDEYNNSVDDAFRFIRAEYTEVGRNQSGRSIYVTKCNDINKVWQNIYINVQQIVVTRGLSRNNLI